MPDFDEVCRRADLYICDNSSSLYEFAAGYVLVNFLVDILYAILDPRIRRG